ncbi:MAG TPA: hypothetical protein VFE25_05280 [Opitutaceae bacterium]|nr:hypothetical protein [Opitutaceae bacterium]
MNPRLLLKLSPFLLCLCLRLGAQELSVLGGATTSGVFEKSTYAWQVDYRQDLYKYFDVSTAYINEGHFPDHLRDGTSFEGWTNIPLWDDHVALSVGAGVYYYYDSEDVGGQSLDVHGTAPIVSFSATGYLSDNWFYRAMVNRITPSSDTKDTTVLVGVGYWFGPHRRPEGSEPNRDAPDPGYVTEPQLTIFGGQTVVNTFVSTKSWAGAVEYRQGIVPHIDGTATFIYEGDPKSERRSGVALQAWPVNTFLDKDTSVGIGVGPYIFIDKRHPMSDIPDTSAAVAPLVSLTVARRLSDHLVARFVWDRVVSSYNRDADIFLVGLGYSWR